jgi:hypothetical protein
MGVGLPVKFVAPKINFDDKRGDADSSETIRKTQRLGWIFFLSTACFMISGVVLFRLNSAEKSFA